VADILDDDGPIRTGHDLHFLERLSRVDSAQTDLALRLYRSPDLVRSMIAQATGGATAAAGGEAGRVAIAIAEGPEPPWVIVAPDGAFVTCLGAGMDPGALDRVPWERTAAFVRRAVALEADVARASEVLHEGPTELVNRLFRSGARLAREHFARLVAVEPLLRDTYVKWAGESIDSLQRFGPAVVRFKRPRPADDAVLKPYWNGYHASGHLIVLMTVGGRAALDPWEEIFERSGKQPFTAFMEPLVRMGNWWLATRALWAIAVSGKLALPHLKRRLDAADNHWKWFALSLGLLAIAHRHQKLRAEVLGCLRLERVPAAVKECLDVAPYVEVLRGCLLGPEAGGEYYARLAEFHARLVAGYDGVLADFAEAERPSLRRAFLANVPLELREPRELALLALASQELVTGPAEDLYLPEPLLAMAPAYDPRKTVGLSHPFTPTEPITRETPKIGRNEPCPCNSGKKYKRCCG